MPTLPSRGALAFLILSATLPACDSSSDLSDISINVSLEGSGSGTIEAQTIGVHVDCKVNQGVISGTCSDSFQDTEAGTIELKAATDLATDFSWGGDCLIAQGPLCELSYTKGNDAAFEVVGRFDSKVVRVVVTPNPVRMTAAGEEVVARARALDKNGAEVLGVSYVWATSDSGVVTVNPTTDSRQATLTAVSEGSALVSATAHGLTGQAQVDIAIQD